MRFLLILFTIINFSFSGALYFGLYYTINDKVGIGLGAVKNNTKNAISGANGGLFI